MKKQILFPAISLLLSTGVAIAQSEGVLIDYVGTTRDNSAVLDIRSTNQGVLVPRVSIANLGAAAPVTTPAVGLLVYNTNSSTGVGYHYWNGSRWTRMVESTNSNNVTGSGTTNYLARWTGTNLLGTGVTVDNGTNVGIGVPSPNFKLQVAGDFHAEGKIVVQNSVDGGGSRGIWMWNGGDSNWGIYMGQSGAGRSLSGGTAVGGGGFAAHAIRTRVNNSNSQGIIFENSAESLLFSVRGGDGQSYHKGNVGINTDPSAKLHILVENDQNDNPANNGIYVQNNDNSGDNGDAIVTTRVAGSGGGDPFFSMDVNGVTGWSVGLDNSDEDKLKFANNWSNPGVNTRMTIQTDGNVGVGDDSPSYRLEVNGTANFSRDNTGVCCPDGSGFTISIAENTATTGRHPSIQFHSAGVAEGQIRLAQYNMAGLPYANRRMHFFDYQTSGLGLELEGNLFYGNNSSRTQTRDNNTLRGNSDGILSGFYETSSATIGEGYPENSNTWVHLLDVRHSNPDNNYAMQMAGSFFDQDFFVRKTNNNGGTSWGRVVTDRDISYVKNEGTIGGGRNAWYALTGYSPWMSVKSGDQIKLDGMYYARATGGSGNDYIYTVVEITGQNGCPGQQFSNQHDYFHLDEDGSNHDNFKPVPYMDVWNCNCNGDIRFRLWLYFGADDNWQAREVIITGTRY